MRSPAITRSNALQPILVASHPRSGTHVVMDLLRRQFSSFYNWRHLGLPLDHLYLNVERLGAEQRQFDEALARKIVNKPKRALLKTHFTPDFASSWMEEESAPPLGIWRDLIESAKTIYVVRHPMDVMASYHQFLSAIDPAVAQMNLMTFMKSPTWEGRIDRLGWWQIHVSGWSAHQGTIVLRYEDVVKTTRETLALLASELDEQSKNKTPFLPPKVTSLRHTRWNRLTQLSPDSTAIIADRKRFPASDWRSSLTQADRDEINHRIKPELARFAYSLEERAGGS